MCCLYLCRFVGFRGVSATPIPQISWHKTTSARFRLLRHPLCTKSNKNMLIPAYTFVNAEKAHLCRSSCEHYESGPNHRVPPNKTPSPSPPPLKVLRTYIWREKNVVPINPRDEEIEGYKCAKSLSELPDPQELAVSVVTPPGAIHRVCPSTHLCVGVSVSVFLTPPVIWVIFVAYILLVCSM